MNDLTLPGHYEKALTDAGWHVRIMGANGEPVFTSEPYTEEQAADEAIKFAQRTANAGRPTTFSDERKVGL